MKSVPIIVALIVMAMSGRASAVVHLTEGRITIDGVQLLQDAADDSRYYYLPKYPRIARNDDGSYELLLLKYTGSAPDSNGGIFHALIEFDLPEDVVAGLRKRLQEMIPDAELAGPVPLLHAREDGDAGLAGFRLVSATLAAGSGFSRQTLVEGSAPVSPGSRAAIAAHLTPQGASLLMQSFQGAASDVSVSVRANYLARVPAYNARVRITQRVAYEHFSLLQNKQDGFTRKQLRKGVDELFQSGELTVDVIDQTEAFNLGPSRLDEILSIATAKLTELMFDHQTGWSAEPEREVIVEQGQIRGRQSRGWLARVFAGSGNQEYYSDDQWVLKDRRDVRDREFQVVLNQASTVRMPLDTSGNLGGLYRALDDERYFRVVDLEDPAFDRATIRFQLDGGHLDALGDTIDFVAVEVRKHYGNGQAVNRSLFFDAGDVLDGNIFKEVTYPRLGETGEESSAFEYRVQWNVRGAGDIRDPAEGWKSWTGLGVNLAPPLQRRVVEVAADPIAIQSQGVVQAKLEFAGFIGGRPVKNQATAYDQGSESRVSIPIYQDPGTQVAWRTLWYLQDGTIARSSVRPLVDDFIVLGVPESLQ